MKLSIFMNMIARGQCKDPAPKLRSFVDFVVERFK